MTDHAAVTDLMAVQAEELLRSPPTDDLFTEWAVARTEALRAFADYASDGGPRAYALYRLAEDRAEAAHHALNAAHVLGQSTAQTA